MNSRQEKAQDLARELGRMGAFVVNAMPLDPDAKGLRVQILDADRDRIVTALCEWGWLPAMLQAHPRFAPGGLLPASLYEIPIPKERPPIVDDRPRVSGEFAKQEKTEREVAALRKYFGW
jgi:hypothetical protein